MSGDVTIGYLKSISYIPDNHNQGLLIAGQNYYDVFFMGGYINNIRIDGYNMTDGGALQATDEIPISRNGVGYTIRGSDIGGTGGVSTNTFRPEDYGAKGDAFGASDGVLTAGVFSSATYFFTAKDVGKSWWQDAATTRTITSVNPDGSANITPGPYGTTGITWVFGTDDTTAVQACIDAAYNTIYNPGDQTHAVGINGYVPSGGIVLLTPGKMYGVFNSAASYNGGAGKLGCLDPRRRITITTAFSPSFQRSGFLQLPLSYGHVIANPSGDVYTDFLTLSNFCIYGYADFSPNSLDGIHIRVTNNINFDVGDPFNRFSNIWVERARRYGYYFSGAGEAKFDCLDALNCTTGIYLQAQDDYELSNCRIGGSYKTSIYLNGAGGNISNCKFYYGGASGGASDVDCAQMVLDGDSNNLWRSGFVDVVGCSFQESRGCSVVVLTGLNTFSACYFCDPGRATIGSGTLPAVLAGVYLKGSGARQNTFSDCFVGPSVTIYQNPNWPTNTYSVYIDDVDGNGSGPQLNQGHIWTFKATINPGGGTAVGTQYTGTGAVTGGGGISNGKNPNLFVDANGAAGGSLSIGSTVASGTSGSILYVDATGKLAQDNTNLHIDPSTKNVGLGTATPNASCILDLVSTTKTFGLPSMTGTQMSAISPRVGAMIYNSDFAMPYFYSSSGGWLQVYIPHFSGDFFTPSSIDFKEAATNGTNKVTLASPAALAADATNTLNGNTGTLLVGTGAQIYDATVTPAGTTGAQTINKPSGTVNFAATATSLVVTNSLCTTNSIVFAVLRKADTTFTQIKSVVPSAGSFLITANNAATAETSVGFFIINQ